MVHYSILFFSLTPLIFGCGESPAPEAPSPQAEPAPAPAVEDAPKEKAASEEEEPAVAKPAEAKDCCCWYSDPAGAGLSRFSADQSEWPLPQPDWEAGCGGGPYYLVGCVDSGICDVAKIPSKPVVELGKIKLTLSSGTSVTVTGSAEHIFNHGEGESAVQVIYYPSPAKDVKAKWTEEITSQGFTLIEGDYPGESHGPVIGFERGDDVIIGEFEEGCQGSKGTCVWSASAVATGADGTAPADGEPTDGP